MAKRGRPKLRYGPTAAGNVLELAEKVDRDEKQVRIWMKREDWGFPKKGPWKIAEVKLWMEQCLDQEAVARNKNGKKLPPSLTNARIEGTVERTLLTRQRRLLERGKLIDIEEAQRIRLRHIHKVKGEFLSLPRSLANALVGKSRDVIEEKLKERIESILRGFSG